MRTLMKNKNGAVLDNLSGLVVALVTVAIVLVVGFLIMSEAQGQIRDIDGLNSSGGSTTHPEGTIGYNATGEVQNAMADIPGWLGIIVITVIGALLIGLVSIFRKGI